MAVNAKVGTGQLRIQRPNNPQRVASAQNSKRNTVQLYSESDALHRSDSVPTCPNSATTFVTHIRVLPLTLDSLNIVR